jgi:hypothetical protein
MRTVVGSIKKNAAEDVEVAIDYYKKQPVIDVRVPAGEKMTTKGLTMGVRRWKEILPIIADAIEQFEKQLTDSGVDKEA